MSHGFRFSIGQAMIVTAILALLMANAMFVTQSNLIFHNLLSAVVLLAGICVLYANRRLSRWIWVWIAAEAIPLLMIVVQTLMGPLVPGEYFLVIYTTFYLASSLLVVLGFAMTFRDIRQRLAWYEDAFANETQGTTSPSDAEVDTIGEDMPTQPM